MQENLPPATPVVQQTPKQRWLVGICALCFLVLAGSIYILSKTGSSVSNPTLATSDNSALSPTTALTASTTVGKAATVSSSTPNKVFKVEPNKQANPDEEPFPKLATGRTVVLQVGRHYGETSEICSVEVHTALTIDTIQADRVTFTLNNKSGSVGIDESINIDLADLKVISMTDGSVLFRWLPVMIEC